MPTLVDDLLIIFGAIITAFGIIGWINQPEEIVIALCVISVGGFMLLVWLIRYIIREIKFRKFCKDFWG